MIVSTRAYSRDEIKHKRIAVPGKLTTAYLVLNLFAPGIEAEVVPFDQIIPKIKQGNFEAGLIIHEGQLTYDRSGLKNRSEEHTSELQSLTNLVCRLLHEKKK